MRIGRQKRRNMKKKKPSTLFIKIKFIFGRISGIWQTYWPDIRPNQYPVQP